MSNKTQPEIAKALLERRNRMSHVILPGEIRAEIGCEGVAEAIAQRWLVPDYDDSGCLKVTTDLGKIEEMRKLANMKPEEYHVDAIPVAESHDMALWHTHRREVIQEVAAPATGNPAPGLTVQGQPQTPQFGQNKQPDYAVGMGVTVAREGRSATGVIEKLTPDGKFQVGFQNGQQKPNGNNIYSKEEMSAVPSNPQRPGQPSQGSTLAPRA